MSLLTTPQSVKSSIKKRSTSLLLFQSINSKNELTNILDLKKKKHQQNKLKNLKLTIQKQLNFLKKKDETLIKNYMKKKQQLKKQLNKKQRYVQDQNYKLNQQQKKHQQLQKRKLQTQRLKTTIKESITKSLQKSLKQKQSLANITKSRIKDWKLQKYNKKQALLQHNKKVYQQVGQSRIRSRQSSRDFFQKRHSMIVKSCRQQVKRQQRRTFYDKRHVEKMQSELMVIRQQSEMRLMRINQLQQDIMKVRGNDLNQNQNQHQCLGQLKLSKSYRSYGSLKSSSRLVVSTPKNVFLLNKKQMNLLLRGRKQINKDYDQHQHQQQQQISLIISTNQISNNKGQKDNRQKTHLKVRQSSLPTIKLVKR